MCAVTYNNGILAACLAKEEHRKKVSSVRSQSGSFNASNIHFTDDSCVVNIRTAELMVHDRYRCSEIH